MSKLIWWFTNIFVCHECGYQHEYTFLPQDDTCPACGKASLKRQVMEYGKQLVYYNPKKHNTP